VFGENTEGVVKGTCDKDIGVDIRSEVLHIRKTGY
jgi:hypothetical protein